MLIYLFFCQDEDSSMGHDSRHDRRGMNDGDMRRGGRTGGAFRSQPSKEMPCGETGPYLDKVLRHIQSHLPRVDKESHIL